jgi:chemotaxis protein methyltransferase CheR
MSVDITYDMYYEKLRDLIHKSSGIRFNDSNRSILETRLNEKLRIYKLSISEYYQMVTSDEGELKVLLDSVTTNLTRFFRTPMHYEALEKVILPHLVKHKIENKLKPHIRMWSAGCSTGEEAYSNAMALKEWLPSTFTFDILASDISLTSLMTANEGSYPKERCQDIPPRFLNKYMSLVDNDYVINPEIKKLITFDYHNLKSNNGQDRFDIVFCRNVLIYFDAEMQKEVADHFYSVMNYPSYLVIGHAESLFGFKTSFKFVQTSFSPLYVKEERL